MPCVGVDVGNRNDEIMGMVGWCLSNFALHVLDASRWLYSVNSRDIDLVNMKSVKKETSYESSYAQAMNIKRLWLNDMNVSPVYKK